MDYQKLEKTLVLFKPDALKNSLSGFLLAQLSEFHTGLCLVGAKVVHVSRMLAAEHYREHQGKDFFASLLDFITGKLHYPQDPEKRQVIALIFQGPEAIGKVREMAGPTNPQLARLRNPGCIRALGTIIPILDSAGKVIGERMDNLIHASASVNDAEREIKLWFRPEEIPFSRRLFPSVMSTKYYYYNHNRLLETYEPESVCLVAPGIRVWQTDLESLDLLKRGAAAPYSLEAVAAKYLMHETEFIRDLED
jgi:nucleoside-diphosphate kinase